MKDFGECVRRAGEFLPRVDNWAACDILSPKSFKKRADALLPKIREWMRPKRAYTCRFGVKTLTTTFPTRNSGLNIQNFRRACAAANAA